MATRKISVEIIGNSASLERSFHRASASAVGFSSNLKKVEASQFAFVRGVTSTTGAMSKFGGVLALTSTSFFAGAGFGAALTSTVKKAAQFEQSLNVLQVQVNASGAAMQRAADLARKLGADVSIPAASAADAAAAMTELAKGGLSLENAMAAARGTLQLAAAALLSNSDAAKIVVSALNSFQLAGGQALHVANLLAGAAAASQGEIGDMALSLQQAAAQAHATGLSVDDTITALTELAASGIQGADAGTSLRRVLQQLTPISKRAQEEMKKLGVNIKDSSGNFRPFREIVLQFHEGLSRLSQVQRAFALNLIFGSDASRAANIIFGQSIDIYDKLRTRVERHNAAQVLASARMKGAVGAAQALSNAVDTLQINIGTQLLPTFTPLINGLAKWVGKQADLEQKTHRIANAITEFSHAVGVLLGGIGRVLGVGVTITKALGIGPVLAFAAAMKIASLATRLFGATQARIAAISAAASKAQAGGAVANLASARAAGINAAASNVLAAAKTKEIASLVREAEAANVAAAASTKAAATAGTAAAASAAAITRSAAASRAAILAQAASAPTMLTGGRFLANANAATIAGTTGVTTRVNAYTSAAARAEKATATLGSRFATFGRGLFNLAGGWSTLAIVGIGGLALGITKLLTRESDWERANKSLKTSLDSLGTSLDSLKTAMLDLAQSRIDVPMAKTALETAKLTVQQDRAALAVSKASRSSVEYRTLLNRLQIDLGNLASAELGVQRAQEGRTDAQRRLRAAQAAATEAAIREASALQRLVGVSETEAQLASVRAARAGRGIVTDQETAAVRRFTGALIERSNALRQDFPAIARNLDLLATLAGMLGRLPTPKEIRLIVNNQSAKNAIDEIVKKLKAAGDVEAAQALEDGTRVGAAWTVGFRAAFGGLLPAIAPTLDQLTTKAATAAATAGEAAAAAGAAGAAGKPKPAPLGALERAQLAEAQARLAIARGDQGSQQALIKALQAQVAYDRRYEKIQEGLIAKGIGDRKTHANILSKLRGDEAAALNEIASINQDRVKNQQDAAQKAADAAKAANEKQQALRTARQFKALGFGPTGEEIVPGVKALRAQLGKISSAVSGTFLDTDKTKSLFARIRRVLSGALGSLSQEVRAKVKEMLDAVDQQLRDHTGSGPQTKYVKASAEKVLAGLGLTPSQMREARLRIAQIGVGGTTVRTGYVGALGVPVPAGGGTFTGDIYVQANNPKQLVDALDRYRANRAGTRRGRNAGR